MPIKGKSFSIDTATIDRIQSKLKGRIDETNKELEKRTVFLSVIPQVIRLPEEQLRLRR